MSNIINSPAVFVTPKLRRRLADGAVPLWEKFCIHFLLQQETGRACETLIDLLALFLERDDVMNPGATHGPLAEIQPALAPDPAPVVEASSVEHSRRPGRAAGSGLADGQDGGPERTRSHSHGRGHMAEASSLKSTGGATDKS